MLRLDGIHHVTSITADARRNVAFYTELLGLRLTARTVNQDDPGVYHLFYGDEYGQPGADLTFFEFPHAKRGTAGRGMVHRVVHRVASVQAIDFWAERLMRAGHLRHSDDSRVVFEDPDGLAHELMIDVSGDEPLVARHPDIPREVALRGFEGVRAYSRHLEAAGSTLRELMGAIEAPGNAHYTVRGDRRGGWIAFDEPPAAPGSPGAGTVHHVAWVSKDEDLPRWIDRVTAFGLPNSGYVDRHYFHSLYFREPGGILYELATEGPGFLVDGVTADELGSTLILPPFLEPRRGEIEANLAPLPNPRPRAARP
jgi:glyoxalase family protein